MKIYKKQKNKMFDLSLSKGFTLIETLVAISIFTTSILTLIVILSQGITSTIYAKDKIIANYLAQEGIEYIHNMRDTYILSAVTPSAGWTDFLTKLIGASCISSRCEFDDSNLLLTGDIAKTVFTSCGTSCSQLLYDSTSGKYGSSGTPSAFVRQIVITPIVGNNEIKVSSTVTWNQGSGSHNVILSENLFNWVE